MQGSQDQKKAQNEAWRLHPAHGHHVAAWRHPEVAEAADVNFPHMVEIARIAERGLFDMLFSADVVGAAQDDPEDLCMSSFVTRFEPITLFSALATTTTHIGLVCTSTTTYDEPYHVARRFAGLDIISGGRSGWNLVTSNSRSKPRILAMTRIWLSGDRYKRAEEFADVVCGLWDSWDDDAFIRDKESGRFFDPDKLHVLDHKGEFFRVRGPLNVARSPQGHPVMVQAGSSERREGAGSEDGRGHFHGAPDHRGREGILFECQRPFGAVWPQARACAHHARDLRRWSAAPSRRPATSTTNFSPSFIRESE